MHFSELEQYLQQHQNNSIKLASCLKLFVKANEDAKTSPNYLSTCLDNYNILLETMQTYKTHEEIVINCLRTLKIIARKKENRGNISEKLVQTIANVLCDSVNNNDIAFEGSNVILNICYECKNVKKIVQTPYIVELLVEYLTRVENKDLISAAVGAIQSISFTKAGKETIISHKGVEKVCPLITEDDINIKSRAIGAIHNLSSGLRVVRILREEGVIACLVSLLSENTPQVLTPSIAGCIQNISREEASRKIIQQIGGVTSLTNLLFTCRDLKCQVCTIGALLNILGPDVHGEVDRKALKKILSLSLFCTQAQSLSKEFEQSLQQIE